MTGLQMMTMCYFPLETRKKVQHIMQFSESRMEAPVLKFSFGSGLINEVTLLNPIPAQISCKYGWIIKPHKLNSYDTSNEQRD